MFLDHDIETVLTDRIKALESKSKDYALQAESGKLLPAMLTVGSIAASIVNPTAPLFALIGAAGYAASLLLDHHNTGRFTPIPCKRSSFREIREELLSDEPIVKTLFDTTIDSLDPGDRQEYCVLTRGIDHLKKMLAAVPPEYREPLYEQAWRNPRNYFPTDLRVVEALEAAEPPALPAASVTVNNDVTVSPTIAAPIVNVSVEAPAPAPAPATAIVPAMVPPRSPQWGQDKNLPTIDLTKNLAAEQNVLIVAQKDSGKTTTVKAAIRHRYEQTNGNCIFWIVDPKGSEFLGLEQSPEHYVFVDYRNIEDLLQVLLSAQAELTRRIDKRRETRQPTQDPVLTILLDEWLSLLAFCESNKKLHEEIIRVATVLAVQGREDKINLWISTHSHQVKHCGFTTIVRDNFAVYALGRKAPGRAAAMESLQAAMADPYLLRDQDTKCQFFDQLREHEPSHVPVIFTPSGGGLLCQLPDLEQFIDWKYPVSQKINPMQIPDCKVEEVIRAIDACASPSQMQTFFELDDDASGKPKSIAALTLWKLVKDEGVERAIEVMLP